MQYTTSNAYATHASGRRMHDDSLTVPTMVTDDDLNMVIWSLMEVVLAGGQTAAAFDPATPATFQKLRNAIQALAAAAGPVSSVFGRAGVVTAQSGDYSVDQVTGAVALTAFTGGNQSLGGSSGFQKLPGGLIVQWGTAPASTTGSGSTNVVSAVFPTTFPNACRLVLPTFENSQGASSTGSPRSSWSVSGANITYANQSGVTLTFQSNYVAIGY